MVKSTKTYDREKALEKLDEFVRPYLESNEIAVLENLQAKIRTINAIQQQEEQKKNRVLITDLFEKYIGHPDVSGLASRTQDNYRAMLQTFGHLEHVLHVDLFDNVRHLDNRKIEREGSGVGIGREMTRESFLWLTSRNGSGFPLATL